MVMASRSPRVILPLAESPLRKKTRTTEAKTKKDSDQELQESPVINLDEENNNVPRTTDVEAGLRGPRHRIAIGDIPWFYFTDAQHDTDCDCPHCWREDP